MINRLLILAAVSLSALLLGFAPMPGVGALGHVDAARAQTADPDAGLDDTAAGGLGTDVGTPTDEVNTAPVSDPSATPEPAPAPAPDPDAGLDDTAAGGLDQSGLGAPVDQTDTPPVADPGAPAPAPAPAPDPDAGLDDTPVGGLPAGTGTPVDQVDTPVADNPAPPVDPGTGTPPPGPGPGTPPPPAGPAPANPAPPAGRSTPTKVKWVRIRVRVGDTVRKIAKRRGLKNVAAIVKRNKTKRGRRKLSSPRTVLRHGRHASKSTRKKDRKWLYVPVS